MRGKVLGTKKSRYTARLLAERLDCNFGYYTDPSEGRYEYVFRYGNTLNLKLLPPVIFNRAFAINHVSNKLKMRHDLLSNGIPAPPVYGYKDFQYYGKKLLEKPLIARTNHHMKGRNFNIVEDSETAKRFLNKGYYLQKIIEKDTEYRIFIWKGEIFETNIKVPNPEMKQDYMVRTLDNGWRFRPVKWKRIPDPLKEHAINAVGLSQLDFGAVDCCVDTNGDFYIFEVNSAPSLFERKADKLAEKVKLWLNENGFEGS